VNHNDNCLIFCEWLNGDATVGKSGKYVRNFGCRIWANKFDTHIKKKSKITVLCILIFTFFYSKLEDKRFCTEWQQEWKILEEDKRARTNNKGHIPSSSVSSIVSYTVRAFLALRNQKISTASQPIRRAGMRNRWDWIRCVLVALRSNWRHSSLPPLILTLRVSLLKNSKAKFPRE
jgi:hypothetical protein